MSCKDCYWWLSFSSLDKIEMTPPPAQINLFTKEAEIKKLARKLSQGWGICSLFELRNGAHVQKECPIQVIGTGTGEATVVTPDYFNCPGHKERK